MKQQSTGIRLSKGTIVDARIIGAPSSTRNQGGRDPERHQTAKDCTNRCAGDRHPSLPPPRLTISAAICPHDRFFELP